jgi:hypothetical protein
LNERIEFFFRNIIAEAIKKDNLMPCWPKIKAASVTKYLVNLNFRELKAELIVTAFLGTETKENQFV